MSKVYWINCRCPLCEENLDYEGSYDDTREKQREFTEEHFHNGDSRPVICSAEREAEPDRSD